MEALGFSVGVKEACRLGVFVPMLQNALWFTFMLKDTNRSQHFALDEQRPVRECQPLQPHVALSAVLTLYPSEEKDEV